MLGSPKYKIGDVVKFKVNGHLKFGTIAIVDAMGTFENDYEVSYDIMVKEEKMLYKHFIEPIIIEKVGEVSPNTIWD